MDYFFVGKILGIYQIEFQDVTVECVLVAVYERKARRSSNGYIELLPRPSLEPVFFHIDEIVRPALVQEINIQYEVEVVEYTERGKKKKKPKVELREKSEFYLNDTVDLNVYDLFSYVV